MNILIIVHPFILMFFYKFRYQSDSLFLDFFSFSNFQFFYQMNRVMDVPFVWENTSMTNSNDGKFN